MEKQTKTVNAKENSYLANKKIFNFYSNVKVQSLSNFTFKGYDAVPLKKVYVEKSFCEDFCSELESALSEEGIALQKERDYRVWIQDTKTFIEHNSQPALVVNYDTDDNFVANMKKQGIPTTRRGGFLEGGNVFLGRFPNGEKWLLSGHTNCINFSNRRKSVINAYGIKDENIFIVPQQHFHLDMFMRPMGYPYVLVNDFNLVKERLEELNDGTREYDLFKSKVKFYIRRMTGYYQPYDETCKALESYGFVPLGIAGNWTDDVNFLNSIANLHDDGSISLITNSSKCDKPYYSKLEEIFERDLRSLDALNIDKIYFIKGKEKGSFSPMTHTLGDFDGGIHCLSLEEPDFEAWG